MTVAVINPLEIIDFSIILVVQKATHLGAAIGTNTSALALKETVSQRMKWTRKRWLTV